MMRQLDEGNHSCVVTNKGETRTYSKKGVRDLYELTHNGEHFLLNALVVDKVIGLGAASLIIAGGAREVRTHLVCTPAVKVLKENNIKITFDTEVDHISNKNNTDWCPLEKRLNGVDNQSKRLEIIDVFIDDLNNGRI